MQAAGNALVFGELAFGAGALALFDPQAERVRWVQSRAGRLGMSSFVPDERGAIYAVTTSPNRRPSGRVERYEPDGHLAWELMWNQTAESSLGDSVVVDVHGELLLIEPDATTSGAAAMVVHRVAASGDVRWSRSLPFEVAGDPDIASFLNGPGKTPIVVGDSLLLVTFGVTPASSGNAISILLGLSADGNRCTRFPWADAYDVPEQLAVGPNGRIYFSGATGVGLLSLSVGDLP
jgi:hypothetical protein